MRTKTIALLTAILLVLGISVAAFAHPRGDPPRDDVSTQDAATGQTTPTKLVREHQPVDHPQVTHDQTRNRDHTSDRTPDQDHDRAREHQPVDHPEATTDQTRDRDHATDRTPDQAREHHPVDHPEATTDQTRDRDHATDRTPDQTQGGSGHAEKGERQEHHSAN